MLTHSMLTPMQQLHDALEKSERPLIVFRAHADGDAIGSALALAAVLRKMGKAHVAIASQGFTTPPSLAFLPGISAIQPTLTGLSEFTITLKTSEVRLKEFRYDQHEGTLRIYLNPEEGMYRPEDVTMSSAPFAYDCIIAVDTRDLESLGALYHKHADFFYRTPTITIDHHPGSEHFGQINIVDVTASSTGEVMGAVLEEIAAPSMDTAIATMLLTAIIAKTRSFKTPKITPRTLQMTSRLVAHGADREKIVHELYRTRSLATLKLWGRVLARLEHDPESQLAWSHLTAADFERTGATKEHLPDIVDELIANAPGVKTTALFYEDTTHPGQAPAGGDAPVCVMLCTNPPHSALELVDTFAPKGSHQQAQFHLPSHNLADAQREVIAKLKERMKTAKIH